MDSEPTNKKLQKVKQNKGGPHSKLRRRARLSAVQALYQMDISGNASKAVIFEFLNHRFGHEEEVGYVAADEAFFEDIVKGVIEFQDEVDAEITLHLSENWKLSRLDKTLRALLRAGCYEILRRPDVPAPVILDQYVSISADFFDVKQAGFVNGALDKIAKKIRKAEFSLQGSAKPFAPSSGG